MAAVTIDSADDARLDPFRHVADPTRVRQAGQFVAEGRRVVEDLLRHGGYDVERLLLTRSAHEALGGLLEALPPEAPVFVVSGPSVLEGVTGHRFHQGCLGLVRLPGARNLEDVPGLLAPGRRLVLAMEGVTDPDNVGTMFRTARAFGVDACLLSPTCAHPLYRKAVRTSMGQTLRLPFAHPSPWPSGLERLREAGYVLFATTPAADAAALGVAAGAVPPERTVVLMGSEERGLVPETLALADHRVRIETEDVVDSLNVAASAAIALHRLYVPRNDPGPRR